MKKSFQILVLFFSVFVWTACDKKIEKDVTFKDQIKSSIYDYLVFEKDTFSSFLSLVDEAGLAKILNAYNPERNTTGYTLFLPDNEAIAKYVQEAGYASLEDFKKDTAVVKVFCRTHVLRKAYLTDNFPYGAFDRLTLSGDQLTASFVPQLEINSMAPVVRLKSNIEASNGYIHVISSVLKPLIYSTYDWLQSHPGYSIFKAAVDRTGFKDVLSVNKKQANVTAITALIEPDSIFNKYNIYNINDLIAYLKPADTAYTNPFNKLYNFVGYHIISGGYFLNQFESANSASNYVTFSDVPILIDSRSKELMINSKNDTIKVDTTFVIKTTYTTVNYDYSNVITLSGVVHVVNKLLTQKRPAPADQTYQFYEDNFLDSLGQKSGVTGYYRINDEDSVRMTRIKYSNPGGALYYVYGESSFWWVHDYLMIYGNFSISYRIPKIIQGLYDVHLSVNRGSYSNAVIQLYIDGMPVGQKQDLTVTGNINSTFGIDVHYPVGTVKFSSYDEHTITIKSVVPGYLYWQYIRFIPRTN